MFSVPSISTLSNSIEASLSERPFVTIRTTDLRRSDKSGLTAYLRHEYGIAGAAVSIGRRSVTVRYSHKSDTPRVVEATREAIKKFSGNHEVVSGKSTKFSLQRFVRALRR